ncbi:oleosin Cor a 13-like [Bidens hawaiensis]|uniref:oleosin Cor a 13-like n=1 Tax=Bidens hawaiensis TaxID=980011 RepID=UPI00404A7F80
MSHKHPHLSHQLIKSATAITIGGSFILLSVLTLTATVIGLVLATPVLVLFSLVLIPTLVTLSVIFSGFLTAGGFGGAASFVFYWMYSYVTGKHPVGSRQVDVAREKVAGAAAEVRYKAEHLGGTGRTTTGATATSG